MGESVWTAIKNNRLPDILDYIINKGDVTVRDEDGQTLLHWAAAYADRAAVTLLALKKVPMNELDRKGRSPLFIACQKGKLDNVKALVQSGAKVDLESPNMNPLQEASSHGYDDIVFFLLKSCYDVKVSFESNKGPPSPTEPTIPINTQMEIQKKITTEIEAAQFRCLTPVSKADRSEVRLNNLENSVQVLQDGQSRIMELLQALNNPIPRISSTSNINNG